MLKLFLLGVKTIQRVNRERGNKRGIGKNDLSTSSRRSVTGSMVISLLQVSGSAQPEAPWGLTGKVGLLSLFRSEFEENAALLQQAFLRSKVSLSVALRHLIFYSWGHLMKLRIPGPHQDRHKEWKSFQADHWNLHFKEPPGD